MGGGRGERDRGFLVALESAPEDDGGKTPFVIHDSVGYLLAVNARLLQRVMTARLAAKGVMHAHWSIMLALWAGDGITQKELSAHRVLKQSRGRCSHSTGRPRATQKRPVCGHGPVQLGLIPRQDPAGGRFLGGEPSRGRSAAHFVADTSESLRDRGLLTARSIGWHRAILGSACKQI